MDLGSFLIGIAATAAPRRYWRSWRSSPSDLTRAAVVSGLLESFFALVLLFYRYLSFLRLRASQMPGLGHAHEVVQLFASGVLSLEYVLQPVSAFLVYMAAEGVVRSWAAYFVDEIVPSLPLKLVQIFQERRAQHREEKALGPILPDLVEPCSCDDAELRIACSRVKPGWRASMRVSINGELYEITRQDEGVAPRRFVYLLRKQPLNKVIRGMYAYEPPTTGLTAPPAPSNP